VGDRVTLNDVAAHAGVSRATASLVLRGTGRVSESTRERVHESMRALGYVRNRAAAALREQRSDMVGLLVTGLGNPLFGELTTHLETEFDGMGYATMLCSTHDSVERQSRLLSRLLEYRVAGLVVVPALGSDPAALELLYAQVPTVFVSRRVESSVPFIGADDRLAGELAARHLLEHGCRRMAYLGGPPAALVRKNRVAGFQAAIDSWDVATREVIVESCETSGAGGLALGRRLLSNGWTPDGVVCHSDAIAFGLYGALREYGVKDESVRVVGFDDVAEAQLWQPALTSVGTQGGVVEGAHRIAALLQDRIAHPSARGEEVRITPELRVRRSCGCHPTPEARM
jgi:LacI family transcriptional regulator